MPMDVARVVQVARPLRGGSPVRPSGRRLPRDGAQGAARGREALLRSGVAPRPRHVVVVGRRDEERSSTRSSTSRSAHGGPDDAAARDRDPRPSRPRRERGREAEARARRSPRRAAVGHRARSPRPRRERRAVPAARSRQRGARRLVHVAPEPGPPRGARLDVRRRVRASAPTRGVGVVVASAAGRDRARRRGSQGDVGGHRRFRPHGLVGGRGEPVAHRGEGRGSRRVRDGRARVRRARARRRAGARGRRGGERERAR